MAGTHLGHEADAGGGAWQYRQEGLVLGPVAGSRLVEMLYAGAIDGKTEISPAGALRFRALGDEDLFKVHLARAEAKRRVDAAAQRERAQNARRRNLRLAGLAIVAVVLATGAAFVARHFAIHAPWQDSDALAFADITVDPPRITAAKRHASEEELVEYPGASRTAARAAPAAAGLGGRAPARGGRKPGTVVDEDGLEMADFDRAGINAVVAARQKSLYPCFVQEAQRTPEFAAKVPLEFVIGNDGRVAQLWIDHPRLKNGPLHECLLKELQKWPFKAYDGERATVGLSFNIGKKG